MRKHDRPEAKLDPATKAFVAGQKLAMYSPSWAAPEQLAHVVELPVRQPKRTVERLFRRELDAAGVKALASMPSLDGLRAKIVGLGNAPATKVAQLVNAPAAKLARVFGAYGAKEAA